MGDLIRLTPNGQDINGWVAFYELDETDRCCHRLFLRSSEPEPDISIDLTDVEADSFACLLPKGKALVEAVYAVLLLVHTARIDPDAALRFSANSQEIQALDNAFIALEERDE